MCKQRKNQNIVHFSVSLDSRLILFIFALHIFERRDFCACAYFCVHFFAFGIFVAFIRVENRKNVSLERKQMLPSHVTRFDEHSKQYHDIIKNIFE